MVAFEQRTLSLGYGRSFSTVNTQLSDTLIPGDLPDGAQGASDDLFSRKIMKLGRS